MAVTTNLQDWLDALDAQGWRGKRTGKERYNGPCPRCGGKDRFWVAQGDRGVITGCNQGCTFEQLAAAVNPTSNGAQPDHEARRRAEAQRIRNGTAACIRRWKQAAPLTGLHPYLEAKGFARPPKGLRTDSETLLVPMRNSKGRLVSTQAIWDTGDGFRKTYAKNTLVSGAYYTIANPKGFTRIYIVEGMATGLSVSLAEPGAAVIVAFSSGQLRNVGGILRDKMPEADIVFAADNDRWNKVNDGVEKARRAASKVGGSVAIPDFQDLSTKPKDFDDLRQLEGLGAVRTRLNPDLAGDAVTSIEEPAAEPAAGADEADEPAYIRRRDLEDLQARYMVDPGSLAHRLLDRMAAKILVVTKSDGDTTALMALPCGRWTHSPDPWRRAIRREIKSMVSDLMDHIGDDMKVPVANRRMNRIHQVLRYLDKTTDAVRAACSSAYDVEMEPYRHFDTFPRPRFVHESELDADLDVMGFENGVVSLTTGKLLDPVNGADRFVTASTGIDYRPDHDHEAVDRLFAHLDPDLRRFWTEALAWALRGRPSRRMYLAVGPPRSGKTTIAAAVRCALGSTYSANLKGDALCEQRGDAAHSGVSVFGQPARVVTVEEPKTAKVDVSMVKQLTGGNVVTVRRLHRNPFEILSTATLFMFSNPGQSVPRLGLADDAMADRLRELPYPAVPVVDPEFVHSIIKERAFREALLARLIAIGANLTGPFGSPDSVKAATQLRAQLDLTPFEEFRQRIVPGHPDDVLPAEYAWSEWCDFVGEKPPAGSKDKVGGYSKIGLGMAISRGVPGIPKSQTHRVRGEPVRGWKGWRLESA